jgi:hypothetical protein
LALETSYSDVGLISDTRYCYAAAAFDAVGNASGRSAQARDTTLVNRTWYQDGDEDGFGDPNISTEAPSQPEGYDHTDCNDGNAAIHPSVEEVCGDNIDQDCDGVDFICPPDPNDVDNDDDGITENQGDCNDSDAAINPRAEEICGDGIDQDCSREDETCPPDPNDVDNDDDGITINEGDCNDSNPTIHPQAEEICGDEIDQDCDGEDAVCPPAN